MVVRLRARINKVVTTYYLHYSLNGVRYRIPAGVSFNNNDPAYIKSAQKSAAEARRAALQISLTYDAAGLYNPNDARVNFYDYAVDYAAGQSSQYVKDCIKSGCDYLQQVAGSTIPFNMITEKMLIKFRKHLEEKLSPETAYKYFYHIKRVMSSAKKEKLIQENPAEYVRNHNNTTPEIKKQSLTIDELKLLAKTPCRSIELKNAMLLSARTGMLLADLRSLTASQVDVSKMEITYYRSKNRGKGKEAVIVPISKDTLKLLDPKRSGKLFSLVTDKYANPIIRQWVADAGINKKITSSCFRTTCATVLLHAGIAESTIIEILGWSDYRMIRKYARPSSEQKRAAIRKLG